MTPVRTPTDLPYATLLGFTRYVARTGPTKATFVGGLRKQRASGGGFNPHGQLVKALKADIQFRTAGRHLVEVVDQVKPRWRPLYSALSQGARRYLESLGDLTDVALLPTHEAIAMVDALPLKVSPHFGQRRADGRPEGGGS